MRGQGPLPSPAGKGAEGSAGHQAGSAKDRGPVSSSSSSRNPPPLQNPCSPGMNMRPAPSPAGACNRWRGSRVASMVGSVFTAQCSPPIHSPGHLTALPPRPAPLQAHLPHPAPLSREPSTALGNRKRGRETETEGGEERRLFCPAWLLCRPRAPTATPTPILAQLGQGVGE